MRSIDPPRLGRPREKRYGWHRRYNGFPYHPKWAAVAERTKVEVCRVLAVADCLMDAANRGRPRGSVADFSARDCAAGLRLPIAVVVKVYRCLERFGWIDRQYLSTWDKRQPDREDATSPERSRRYREKKLEQLGTCAEKCTVASVTTVLVTPKTETKTQKKRKRAPSVSPDQRTMPLCVVVSSTPPPEQAAPQMASSGKEGFEASPQLRAILAKQGA